MGQPSADKINITDRLEVTPGDQLGATTARSGIRGRILRLGALAVRVSERVPAPWPFVVGLFVGSKLVLTLIGLVALQAYVGVAGAPAANEKTMWAQQHAISPHRFLSMWFAWDSFLYDNLARVPLTGRWQGFSFPLLYPFLARPVAVVLGGNTPMALLLVSNIAFLLMLYYAYRLAERLLGNGAPARRFVKYLVLMPAAFLFQAALTESLFLCLALATFYYAEQRRWLVTGIVGFFLALSRSVGFLVAVPLALVLLRQHRYRLGPRALWEYLRIGWPLVLVPAGWLTFMAFCKWQGGDWLAYKHAQERGWGISLQNPLAVMVKSLTGNPSDAVRVWFAVAVLAIVIAGARRIGAPYLVYTLIMVLVPLSMGPPVTKSLLRYLLTALPVCLVLAQWARNVTVDAYLTAILALVQGTLFVLWLAYWTHFII